MNEQVMGRAVDERQTIGCLYKQCTCTGQCIGEDQGVSVQQDERGTAGLTMWGRWSR